MDLRLFLALSVLLVVEAFNSLQEEFPSDNLEQDDHFGRKGRGEYWYNLKHEKTLIWIELFSSVIFVSSCNFSGMPDYMTWLPDYILENKISDCGHLFITKPL